MWELRRRLVVLAALVAWSGILGAAGQAGAAPAAHGETVAAFKAIDPHQSDSSLGGVSCPTASFCMAVGYFEDESTTQPLAERFDGTKWTNADARLLSGGEARLASVSCTSSSFCMAVGTGADAAIAEEWNGHSWSVVATDAHATDSTLRGVSCPADDLCAAVGQYDGGSTFEAMVQYWNGGAFFLGPAAEETGDVSALDSVSCPNMQTCMAVGSYENSNTGATLPLTEVDVAGTWTLEPVTGTNSKATNELVGVSCTATSACMAVGDSDLDGAIRALSYSWDGTTWSRQPAPQPGTAVDELAAVTCRGSDDANCVAVGDDSDAPLTSDRPDLSAWNGVRWTTERTPAALAPFERLTGTSCSSASRCVAVGTEADTVTTVAFAVSGASGAWVDDSVPNPRRVSEILAAVSCATSTQCVAVGGYEGPSTPLAEVWTGSVWKTEAPKAIGQSADLSAVACPVKNHCVAVGEVDFDRYSVPTARAAVLAESETQGLVETWNGSTWSSATLTNSVGASEELTAVWCRGSSFCVAVGTEDGSMPDSWIWRGRSWSEVSMPATAQDDDPTAIRCPTTSECIAVGSSGYGAQGFAERWNGKVWSVSSVAGASYAFFAFAGLACPALNRCSAVGAQDVVYDQKYDIIEQWNGRKWSVVPSPAPAGYYGGLAAVSCVAPDACLAAGPSFDQSATTGLVLHWNGTTWSIVTLPAAAHGEVNLLGVFVMSPTSAVVVGTRFDGAGFAPFALIESAGHWRAT